MKLKTLTFLGALIIGLTVCVSCKNTYSKESLAKENEAKYLKTCIATAKKSFENAGIEPNEALIEEKCKCIGEQIKIKYGFSNLPSISKEETMSFMKEAAVKCAQ